MTWKERWIGIPLAAVGAILALAAVAALVLTRTPWGLERVRHLLEEGLLPRLSGHVTFRSIAGGDLLGGLRLSEVRVLDPDGGLVLDAETVDVGYDWKDVLAGNVVIRSVRLVRPVIVLQKGRDGRWNFERALEVRARGPRAAERPPQSERGRRTRIELRDISVVEGSLTVRVPEDAPSDFWYTEEAADGHWRVVRLPDFDGKFPLFRLPSGSGDPLRIRVAALSGLAEVVRQPAMIRDLRADIEVVGDSVSFDIFHLALPESRLFGQGFVRLTDQEPRLDVVFRGERVSFADLTWLVSWLPAQGRGAFEIHLASTRRGLAFAFENTDVRLGASHFTGRLGFVLRDGGGVEFEELDVGLHPLETRWIEQLSGDPFFFAGRLRGQVRGDGPLDQMTLESDLILEPADGGAPSHVLTSGVLAWDGSFGGHLLDMTFNSLDMAVVKALFGLELPVQGSLQGRATFTGTLRTGLEVEADLVHSDGSLARSHLWGGGRVLGVERPRVDLWFQGDPLSLTALAQYYPALPFRGDLRGPIELRGTFDTLDVDARLHTPRGGLVLRGRFDLRGEPKRYAADLEGVGVQVAAIRPGVPGSDLNFRAHVEGEGSAPEELRLRGWARILPSEFAGARVDGGFVRLVAEDGVLRVDTAALSSEAGTLGAEGSFGLREDTRGTLTFGLRVDTMAAWNQWIAPRRDTLQPAATFADGSGALPAFTPEPGPRGSAGPLGGDSVSVAGSLSGNLDSLRLEGRAWFTEPSWTDAKAEELTVTVTAEGPPRSLRVKGRVDALDVRAFGVELSTAHLDVSLAGDTARFAGELVREPVARVRARAKLVRLQDGAQLTVESFEAAVRGRGLSLQSPVTMVRQGPTLFVRPFQIAGSLGTAVGEAEIPETGRATLALNLSGLDLGDLAAVLPPLSEAKGALRLDLRLAGSVRDPSAEFEVEASDGRLGGVAFSRLLTRGRYEGGELRWEANAWRDRGLLFEASGQVPVDLDLHALRMSRSSEPMELDVRAEAFPLAFAVARFDQFRDVEGQLQGEVRLRGSFEEPDLEGEIRLSDGAVRLPQLGVGYFDVQGRVRLRGDLAELEDVVVRGLPEGGRGRVEGSLRLRPLSNPEFNLQFTPERLLAYMTRIAETVVSGSINLTGVYEGPVITGTLTMESGALFVREVERRREIVDLSDPDFLNVVETAVAENRRLLRLISDPFFENMTVDVTLRLTRDSWLRARDRAIEIAGDLQLLWDRAQRDLRIRGNVEALRGEYTYLGKRFTVEGRTVNFVGTPGVNPDLDLVARHVVQTRERPLTIRIHVTGTLEDPKIRLDSDAKPPLGESALLSYLLFGRPFSELTRGAGPGGRPGVVSTVQEGVLGYAASELESFLVAETGLVDVLNITGGQTVDPTYRGEENGAGLGTRVEAGWYLAPDVFVAVGRRFGGNRRSDIPDVRLDWRVTRNLSLEFVSEERGQRFDAAPADNPAPERTFGLFFFHQWSY